MTNYTIQFKRGTGASLTEANPILSQGEPAFETDTGLLKIGDGFTPYNSLSYVNPASGGEKFNFLVTPEAFSYTIPEHPAAGVVFNPIGIYGIEEYKDSDNIENDGACSFVVGRNISIPKTADYCTAFGAHHKMNGYGSVVFGNGAEVSSNSQYSLTCGRNISNYGSKAIALGESTNKLKDFDAANAEEAYSAYTTHGNGKETAAAVGNFSASIGTNNFSYGAASIAMGQQNFTGGVQSVAMGLQNETWGKSAVALGYANKAKEETSIAIGNHNIASAMGAVALGYNNEAAGGYSLTSGTENKTSVYGAHALGRGLNASVQNGTVVGQWNASKNNLLFSVGNGASTEERSNALEVYTDGRVEVPTQGDTDASVVRMDTLINRDLCKVEYHGVYGAEPNYPITLKGPAAFPSNIFTEDLTHSAYSQFAKLFVQQDDYLFAEKIEEAEAYYFGWTSGSDTSEQKHIDTGTTYVLKFDLKGSIAVYDPVNQWTYHSSKDWSTQYHYFTTKDTIDNYNYLLCMGAPKGTTYTDVCIKNLAVYEAPILSVSYGDNKTLSVNCEPGKSQWNFTIPSVEIKSWNVTIKDNPPLDLFTFTYYQKANARWACGYWTMLNVGGKLVQATRIYTPSPDSSEASLTFENLWNDHFQIPLLQGFAQAKDGAHWIERDANGESLTLYTGNYIGDINILIIF